VLRLSARRPRAAIGGNLEAYGQVRLFAFSPDGHFD
jgi:hypothetical protein